MQLSIHNRQAFTLIEIIITVIIIGVVTALAIPNFNKAKRIAHEEDLIVQLQMLHEASKIYYSKNDGYYPGDASTEAEDLNNNLQLNIILNNATLVYNGTASCYRATMQHDNIAVTTTNLKEPCCSSAPGTCPQLAGCGALPVCA